MKAHIERTYPDGFRYIPWRPASFSAALYEAYAREAIRFGALVVRVVDDEGNEVYRRTMMDA